MPNNWNNVPVPVDGLVLEMMQHELKKKKNTEVVGWKNPTVLMEYGAGHPLAGYKLLYVDDPEDTATLGRSQGHCAGTHWVWTSEERIWYFYTIIDGNGRPHCTIHAKQNKWLNKQHPRDLLDRMPVNIGGVGGYYPVLSDCLAAFKAAGLEYEPGKYAPQYYSSFTYDRDAAYYKTGSEHSGFERIYGQTQVKEKPEVVSNETWDAWTKAYKALKDEFDRQTKELRLPGRTFKFDGKELIILSFTGGGQSSISNSAYARAFNEWLIELNKSKKKVV